METKSLCTRLAFAITVALSPMTLASVVVAADCTDGSLCDCGDTIPENAKVTLTAAAPILAGACNTFPVLTLESGASLDMDGHEIACQGVNGDGIHLDGSGGTLKNGALSTCIDAVQLNGAGKHKVSNMHLSNSINGVNIVASGVTANNKLTENVAYNNFDYGFFETFGGGNKYTRNTAANNTDGGFRLLSGNKLKGNTAFNNGGPGFEEQGSASGTNYKGNVAAMNLGGFSVTGDGTKMKGNIVTDNGGYGVSLGSGAGAKVGGNHIVGNVRGIQVDGSEHKIKGNLVHASGLEGIEVAGTASSVQIKGNRIGFSGGGGGGIIVENGASQISVSNNISLQTSSGSDLVEDNAGCGTNTWSKNVFETTNEPGCVD